MASIEQTIKKQYAKVFRNGDWESFKLIAEYYFKTAATLRRAEIQYDKTFTLLIRNIQKRLFLGIGCELLLKSVYLKNKYVINTPIVRTKKFPISFSEITISQLNRDNTFTLSILIDQLHKIVDLTDRPAIEAGLKILKVFRNKEGHVSVFWHKYKNKNYRDIETAIGQLYQDAFNETVLFSIAMEAGDVGQFEIIDNLKS